VNKLVVGMLGMLGMLGVLCLVAGTAAFAIVQATERLSADLHRSAIALDALVARVTAAEEDLASIADDVYTLADDVGAIADSLAPPDGDDGQGGESVGVRAPLASGRRRAARAAAMRRSSEPGALARVSRAPFPAAGGR
jgi:hypothetical protein